MKKSYGKRLLAVMLSAVMAFTMMPLLGVQAFAGTEAAAKTVKIAILSDIHYVNDENREAAATDAFRSAEKSEKRMMSEIGLILDQALNDAAGADPDVMLVCGDLCSNGEKSNEEALADRLADAEEDLKAGAKIYVVNGNHDINNSYSADFTGSGAAAAARTQADDFRQIYEKLGYGSGDGTRFYNSSPGEEVKNYGALSYATEIQPGITLIALDTGQYSEDDKAGFDNAQTTAGSVSEGLLSWAAEEAAAAKEKGNLVLAMCHHSIIPHHGVENDTSDLYFGEFLVSDWEHVAGTLADAGVSAIMTGHSHASDISQYTTKAGSTIYDIQTSALCAYPCAWRELSITIDRSSGKPEYSFDIDTHFIESVEGLNLTYNGVKYKSLQDYSFVKTGVPEDSLPDVAGLFIRKLLFSIKSHEGGFNGYLKEKVKVPDQYEYFGEYAVDEISKLIDGIEPVAQEFTLLGTDCELTLSLDKEESTKTEKVFDVSLKYLTGNVNSVMLEDEDYSLVESQLNELKNYDTFKDTFSVSYDEEEQKNTVKMEKGFPEAIKAELCTLAGYPAAKERTEKGKLIADLSGLADGINDAVGKAEACIEGKDGDWDNNYKRTAIETEADKLIASKAKNAFTEPVDENDKKITPLYIARDAIQSFARGDEDSFVEKSIYGNISASDLNAKRKKWNELLRSEAFENNLRLALGDCVKEVKSKEDEYRSINSILDTYIGPEEIDRSDTSVNVKNLKPVFTFEAAAGTATTLKFLYSLMLGQIRTAKDILTVTDLLSTIGVDPLTAVSFGKLTNMLAELQLSLTTDSNIRSDSEWAFHTVNLDTRGGSVSAPVITTVEGNKAGALPDPSRPGYVFRGWFTAADGGDRITENSDLENVTKLYARWEAVPGPDPETDPDPGTKPDPGTASDPGAASAQSAEASVNAKTVNAALVRRAIQAAGGNADTLVLGKKVKKISKGALAGTGIKTLIVTTKKLTKKSVKGSLRKSGVTTVRVRTGKAAVNKKYAKKYSRIFTKKNAGRKVTVRKY